MNYNYNEWLLQTLFYSQFPIYSQCRYILSFHSKCALNYVYIFWLLYHAQMYHFNFSLSFLIFVYQSLPNALSLNHVFMYSHQSSFLIGTSLVPRHLQHLIRVDFNRCLNSSCPRSSAFITLLFSINLSIQQLVNSATISISVYNFNASSQQTQTQILVLLYNHNTSNASNLNCICLENNSCRLQIQLHFKMSN